MVRYECQVRELNETALATTSFQTIASDKPTRAYSAEQHTPYHNILFPEAF